MVNGSETHRESLALIDLQESWRLLTPEERLEAFDQLDRAAAEDFFLELAARDQYELLRTMAPDRRRAWVRLLPPDDIADVLQLADEAERESLMALLDDSTLREVAALLAYSEDEAGGLMNPRFARVRPDVTVDEAIRYLRKQVRAVLETINYVYVLDAEQKLLGVVSFRDLFAASAEKIVRELMTTADLITAREDMDQEELARLFAQTDLQAIPVVDATGHMKGIVTVDDIVDVIQEEATEDIQKIGGTRVLEAPYLEVGLFGMIRKRVGWLAVLFVGEMLTTAAMGRFEAEIARAVVLAVFIPLLISSGGNAGSQASTLVIRAMALGEVRLADWWRVVHRELLSGLAMGGILGVLAFARIELWEMVFHTYGAHHMLIALTIAISVVGIVTWGTFSGSMLPFFLRLARLDPATASAPFVATLVDVTGIVLYFTVASAILRGTLL